MKQYDFTYSKDKQLEAVKETLLDQMCEKLNTNVKDTVIKSTVDDCYQNFVVELENGKEIDCEISFEVFTKEWQATVWEME